MIVIFGAIFLFSCNSDDCECDKYRDQMHEITISEKSFDIEDLEIKDVGKYCCSRKKGNNDWTCILKSDAEMIVNYDGENVTPEATKRYFSGFVGLSIDIYNIEDINILSEYQGVIDSVSNLSSNKINAIFFDQHPKSIYFEMKDRNNSLIEEGILIKN